MTNNRTVTICLLTLALMLGATLGNAQETLEQRTSLQADGGSFFESWSAQLGYITGNLRAGNGDDLQILMFLSRFKHPINELFGLKEHKGKLSLVAEPFVGQIYTPDNAMMLGVGGFFEYAYPVTDRLDLHAGFGSGPSYFGLDTLEEGGAGFQFFDSASAGASFNRSSHDAFLFEFRAVHISDLSIREPNNGINAYSFFFGYNSKF